MGFSIALLDKTAALEQTIAAKHEVSQKLLTAEEPKVIALSYDLPMTRPEQLQLSQFEAQRFLSESLSHRKGHIKSPVDNPRISPQMAELDRVEADDKVTVLYHGKTGVLEAIRGNGLILENELVDSMAAQIASSSPASVAAPAKPKGRAK